MPCSDSGIRRRPSHGVAVHFLYSLLMTVTRAARVAAGVSTLVMVAAISACSPNPGFDVALGGRVISGVANAASSIDGEAGEDGADPYAGADDWIIVHFADNPRYSSADAFDRLENTEFAADDALAATGEGWLDGNEVGGESYDLYFFGYEKSRMWAVLEPVFDEAPLAWTSVELLDDLDDPTPTIIERP